MADLVSRRKRIKRAFHKRNPGRKFAWLGGVLHDVTFSGQNPVPVKGAPEVPKGGKPALGLSAARPAPGQRAPRTSHSGSGGYGSYGGGSYGGSSSTGSSNSPNNPTPWRW